MEVWKDIEGYEGLYQVSNLGRVKSLGRYKQNHTKTQWIDEKIKSTRISDGYYTIDLYKNNIQKTIRVHQLIAKTFILNPENKTTINHINGNKIDNRVTNLEWSTPHEQNIHFYQMGLKSKKNIKKAVKAMNEANAKGVECLNTGITYKSIAEASRKTGASASGIGLCCRNIRNYAGVDKNGKPMRWSYS